MRYNIFWQILALLVMTAVALHARADAWVIDVEGAIGPAMEDHVTRGLGHAGANGAELVVLRIDTPGGLDTAMRGMIKSVLAAPMPVLAYVSPGGARAASAGTYILYAAHLAAMAPGTNLGAATPVQIGTPRLPDFTGSSDEEGDETVPVTAMEQKIVNDAVAYIQSLAQLRGRNAQWAEAAVRQGASLAAEDALQLGVIDVLATTLEDLLVQVDGRQVRMEGGIQTLDTQGLDVHAYAVDWRSEFLAVITNPNVAYVLMLVGFYGLLIEFYNPGIGLPGVMGAISLLLALYAFQALPVSYVGFGLILLGIALMTAEVFAPSFGILGLGGIAAFVIGSIMLMDTELAAFQIAMPIILGFAVFTAVLLAFALGMIVKARRQAVVSGIEHLLGASAEVESVQGDAVRVRLDGELWLVACEDVLSVEDTVTVQSIDGLTLHVSKGHEG